MFSTPTKLLSAIGGGLLASLVTMPLATTAQTPATRGRVNPCPSIYYEVPHDNRVFVPQGCPPNAYTQRAITLGLVPARNYSTYSATPTPQQIRQGVGGEYPAETNRGVYREPLVSQGPVRVIPAPEMRQSPIAMVMPMNGRVDVKLKNNTNAVVSYEAVAHTQRRFLAGGEEIVLRDLPTPVTITMVRQDKGFLDVMPVSTKESGILELSLDEAKNFDDNQGVVRIQEDGEVFLN
jgi:hypothetical protein